MPDDKGTRFDQLKQIFEDKGAAADGDEFEVKLTELVEGLQQIGLVGHRYSQHASRYRRVADPASSRRVATRS